jgi:hypothetical protein
LSAPGRADLPSANLTPASRRQDHTTSPYAATSLVRSLGDRSRAQSPPCDPVARKTLPRPPHPSPRFVTIMIRPSVGWDARSPRSVSGCVKTGIFLRGLDTDLPDGQISRLVRRSSKVKNRSNGTTPLGSPHPCDRTSPVRAVMPEMCQPTSAQWPSAKGRLALPSDPSYSMSWLGLPAMVQELASSGWTQVVGDINRRRGWLFLGSCTVTSPM